DGDERYRDRLRMRAVQSSKTFVHSSTRHRVVLALPALIFGLLLVPGVALADAPGTRGTQAQAHGGVSAAPTGASWSGVRELPPPAVFSHGSASMPFQVQQQGGQDSGPIAWLGRNLNPGNWILDAGMGIFAGIVKMF